MPCKALRVFLRVAQVVVDVYYIVAETWETGIQWSALLERRSRWVAIFIWACIIHVGGWMALIALYTMVVSFSRSIQIIFSYTPFASVWWILQGVY